MLCPSVLQYTLKKSMSLSNHENNLRKLQKSQVNKQKIFDGLQVLLSKEADWYLFTFTPPPPYSDITRGGGPKEE